MFIFTSLLLQSLECCKGKRSTIIDSLDAFSVLCTKAGEVESCRNPRERLDYQRGRLHRRCQKTDQLVFDCDNTRQLASPDARDLCCCAFSFRICVFNGFHVAIQRYSHNTTRGEKGTIPGKTQTLADSSGSIRIDRVIEKKLLESAFVSCESMRLGPWPASSPARRASPPAPASTRRRSRTQTSISRLARLVAHRFSYSHSPFFVEIKKAFSTLEHHLRLFELRDLHFLSLILTLVFEREACKNCRGGAFLFRNSGLPSESSKKGKLSAILCDLILNVYSVCDFLMCQT